MNTNNQVEKIGIELENIGFPPIVCRVIAFLLISEPQHQSFYQIQEFLQASKSAISYALNFLMKDGEVEVITFPGDRKRYFKLRLDAWIEIIRKRVSQITASKTIFESIATEKEFKNPDYSKSLQEIADLFDHIENTLMNTIEIWDENKKKMNFNVEFNKLINKSRKL